MKIILAAILFHLGSVSFAQVKNNVVEADILPVRGFCIAAPQPGDLERFIKFIDQELAPRNVNTLILRVDFNYQYESHPELRDSSALSKT